MEEIIAGALRVIAIQTGRVLVRLISVGKWRGEPLFGDEGRIYAAAGAFSFVRDGKRVITESGLSLVGGTFYLALLFAVIAVAAVA
ncbi:hypothetical protein HUU62_06195 [Rhodoferax sp. 4810]|nr:hypothetical protein [Rhodoferax jenense]